MKQKGKVSIKGETQSEFVTEAYGDALCEIAKTNDKLVAARWRSFCRL